MSPVIPIVKAMKNSMNQMMIAVLTAGAMFIPVSAAEYPYDYPMEHVLHAAQTGTAELQKLLSANVSINSTNNDGDTALMKAADDGKLDAVKTLLSSGANVNARNESGETALMLAADEGHTEIVKELIAAGADIHLHDEDDETALMKAVEEKHEDTASVLRAAGAR